MSNSSLSDELIQGEEYPDALADKVRMLESVLRAADLAVITLNLEGTITGFNSSAETLLGYSSGEVVGKLTPLVFHDHNEILKRAQVIAKTTNGNTTTDLTVLTTFAQNQRGPDRNEWTMVRKDGTRFPSRVSVIASRDNKEKVIGFTEIIVDISEQATVRSPAPASEEKFRLLAENIPGAIYLCLNDEAYTALYLNDHMEKITGYPAEDFLTGKRSIASIIHPDDRQIVFDKIEEKVAQRQSFKLRYRMRHASGEWRWFDEVGIGVYVNDQLTMLQGLITDITFQKEAEEKIQGFADENFGFFNNPVNLNAITDFDGTLHRISPSWTKLVGWTEDELRSQPFINFIHPEDAALSAEVFQDLLSGKRVPPFENRVRSKSGHYHWVLWSPASDVKQKMIYASAIDITERKKSEENILDSKSNLETLAEKLKVQNRQLDEFAHIISHNLRAPVNNIHALINLLNDNSNITDYKLIFDKLKNVSKNLGETMNELMDTLKVKTDPDIDRSEIRLKEILDKVVQTLEGELIVAEASVTFDFNAAPTIEYSKPYLESIFQNLLTNAIKYRSPNRKPEIHFQSSLVNGRVQLSVSDNGQGIDLARVGDKLFGLHKTFHDHEEARGVGLFLIKTQIQAMGGNITAESEVDQGTTFIITFGK